MTPPETASEWVNLFILIATLVLGSGGLVAYLKYLSDRKQGVRQEDRGDSDSLNARAVAIVQSQAEFLVEPLKVRVTDLETEVKTLKQELSTFKTKYLAAVLYIKRVLGWVSEHVPERDDFPAPPTELAPDL